MNDIQGYLCLWAQRCARGGTRCRAGGAAPKLLSIRMGSPRPCCSLPGEQTAGRRRVHRGMGGTRPLQGPTAAKSQTGTTFQMRITTILLGTGQRAAWRQKGVKGAQQWSAHACRRWARADTARAWLTMAWWARAAARKGWGCACGRVTTLLKMPIMGIRRIGVRGVGPRAAA